MKRFCLVMMLFGFGIVGCGSSTEPTKPANPNPEPAAPGPKGKDGKADPKKPGFG